MDAASRIYSTLTLRPGAALSSVHQSRQRTQEFAIRTSDGDAVKITISSSKEFSALRYNSSGSLDNSSNSLSANSIDNKLEKDVSIEVEGDLSEREKREIEKAIKLIQKAYSDFDKGLEVQSENALGKVSRLDSIAEIAASFSESNELKVTGSTQLYA